MNNSDSNRWSFIGTRNGKRAVNRRLALLVVVVVPPFGSGLAALGGAAMGLPVNFSFVPLSIIGVAIGYGLAILLMLRFIPADKLSKLD